MTIRRHGKGWMADVQLELPNGSTVRKRKAGFATQREAQDFERRLRQELLDGTYERKRQLESAPTVAQFIGEYLEAMEATNRASTIVSKRTSLRGHVAPAIGHVLVREVGARHFEAVRAQASKTLSASTVNLVIVHLAHMLSTAEQWGLRGQGPKVRKAKAVDKAPRFLSDDEARALLGELPERWRRMAQFALHTGLRVGELLGLQWDDIDAKAKTLTVRRTTLRGTAHPTHPPKSGKQRTVPLNADALAVLSELPTPLRPKGERVFPGWYQNANKAMQRAAHKACLERVGWHTLRHTFATRLCLSGAPIRVVQELLGHASLAMTQRYTHTTSESLHMATRLLEGRA